MRSVISMVSAAVLACAALVLLPAPALAAGTVTVSVSGQGSVSGEGIGCTQAGGDCSEFYADTTYQDCDPERKPPCFDVTEPPSVSLVAGPDSNGFVYDGWIGCDSVTGRTCDMVVESSRSVQARFRDAQPPSVSAPTPSSGVRRGTVTLATTAADNAGVTKVEFYVGQALRGSDTSAPYELLFDTTTRPDGAVSLTAKAYDAAGNVTTSAASGFTIDNTAPVLNLTGGPDGETFGPGTTQVWSFTASDATSGVAAVECGVVAVGAPSSYGACTGGSTSHSVSGLPDGSYRFVVRARDAGGLVTAHERTFSIDATGPTTTITGGPAAGATVPPGPVTWTFAGEDGQTWQCRLYAAGTTAPDFGDCSGAGSHTASGLADGGYVFEVRGRDAVGNAGPGVARAFTIATPPPPPPPPPPTTTPPPTAPSVPDTVIDARPRAKVFTRTSRARVKVRFHGTVAGSSFQCKVDRGSWKSCSSVWKPRLKVGKHVLRVRARVGSAVDPTPAVIKLRVVRR